MSEQVFTCVYVEPEDAADFQCAKKILERIINRGIDTDVFTFARHGVITWDGVRFFERDR